MQVSLETSGKGSVLLNGDVLWGGSLGALPKVPYIYNLKGKPFPEFERLKPEHVLPEREKTRGDPLGTGYFGLNVRVEQGRVWFGGNLGMFESGVRKYQPAAKTLDEQNNGTALRLTIQTGTYTRQALPEDVAVGFAPGAEIYLGRFWIENPWGKATDRSDVVSTFFAPPVPEIKLLPNRGNMPSPSIIDTGPNALGPSPRNAPSAPFFASIGPLPEISVQHAGVTAPERGPMPAPGDAAGISRATLIGDSLRAAESSTDVGPGEPLVTSTGGPLHGADDEYFSLGPFELIQARTNRTPPGP